MERRSVTRRTGILSVLMGVFSVSCITPDPSYGLRISFQDSLEILRSVTTLSEFMSATGLGGVRRRIRFDDANDNYFNWSRNTWEQLHTSSPSDLLQEIPVGTMIVSFQFTFNQPLNPTSAQLYVCVDENDRVIGWFYSRSLIGHEREAMPG